MPYIVKYSLKRIGLLLVTIFIILTITFFLVKMLPEKPVTGTEEVVFGFYSGEASKGYYEIVNEIRPDLGDFIFSYSPSTSQTKFYVYKVPAIRQYFSWLTGIFTRWDWGTSEAIQLNAPAMDIIAARLPATVLINVLALVISLPLGFIFGIVAALHKNSWLDNLISTIVMIFISVPSFVIISFLILWLGFNGNLPSQWPTGSNADIGQYASALVIPVLALCFGTIALFTRYTRAELTEVMSSEFLLLARTKGLTRGQAVVRHALRNSMVPIVPMIIGQFISILSGSVVLEQLYVIPGIGRLFVESINYHDYNVLLVDMAFYTLIGLFANLVVDLSYGIVDPRIRMGASS
mgnify:CR=1 FL=1